MYRLCFLLGVAGTLACSSGGGAKSVMAPATGGKTIHEAEPSDGHKWLDPNVPPGGAKRRFGNLSFRFSGPVGAMNNGWVTSAFNELRVWREDGRYFALPGMTGKYVLRDDDHIVTVSQEGSVVAQDLKGTSVSNFDAPDCWRPVFSSDGSKLICETDKLNVYDTKTGAVVFTLPKEEFPPTHVVFGGGRMALIHDNQKGTTWLSVIDIAKKKRLRHQKGQLSGASIALSADGRTLYVAHRVGAQQNFLRAKDAATGNVLWQVEGEYSALRASPDGKHLVAQEFVRWPNPKNEASKMGGEYYVTLFAGAPDKKRRISRKMQTYPTSFDFSPDGKRLAAGTRDDQVFLYDVASGHRVFGPETGLRTGRQAAVLGDRVASVGLTGTLDIWQRSTGKNVLRTDIIAKRNGSFTHLQFLDEDRLFVWDGRDQLVLVDLKTGKSICQAEVRPGLKRQMYTLLATKVVAVINSNPGSQDELVWVDKNCKTVRSVLARGTAVTFSLEDGRLRSAVQELSPTGSPKWAWYQEHSMRKAATQVAPKRFPIAEFFRRELGIVDAREGPFVALHDGKKLPLGAKTPLWTPSGNRLLLVEPTSAGAAVTVVDLATRRIAGQFVLPANASRPDLMQFDPEGRHMVVVDGASVLLYDLNDLPSSEPMRR